MKNILEICLSPDLGGLELCVIDNFNYFSEKTLSYICVAPGSKLDSYLEDNNKYRLKRNKFFPLIPALKLAKFIDDQEIDLIHFHWTKDIVTVVLAKLFSQRKLQVVQSRHMTMTRFKSDIYHKWLYKNIDLIHAVTYQVKEQLKKFIPQNIQPRIEMVYLGVSEPHINYNKVKELQKKYEIKDDFVIGMVGRIEEGKGQYLLIEAISKLQYSNVKVLIVGSAMSNEYLLELKEKVKKLDIEDKVIFTGFTKDVNEYIQLCDVTVLATPKETFGLVVIESMVNSVPVIATDNGGPLEIIENGISGLLFDRSSNDLMKKIAMLYEDRVLKAKIATNSYKHVKNMFDKEKQMNKLYEVINES